MAVMVAMLVLNAMNIGIFFRYTTVNPWRGLVYHVLGTTVVCNGLMIVNLLTSID